MAIRVPVVDVGITIRGIAGVRSDETRGAPAQDDGAYDSLYLWRAGGQFCGEWESLAFWRCRQLCGGGLVLDAGGDAFSSGVERA